MGSWLRLYKKSLKLWNVKLRFHRGLFKQISSPPVVSSLPQCLAYAEHLDDWVVQVDRLTLDWTESCASSHRTVQNHPWCRMRLPCHASLHGLFVQYDGYILKVNTLYCDWDQPRTILNAMYQIPNMLSTWHVCTIALFNDAFATPFVTQCQMAQ